MPKEMLINVAQGEECRIALLDDGRVDELYMERTSAASHVGNIYKGRVTNVEASIQAAFIDFGVGRNGFLHVSDLLPTYFGGKGNDDVEEYVGKKMARRDRPPIQRCLRRGDEIIVQVIKEGIGTKGPTLSSYLSISGKMLVMMPGVAGRGVSKKIEDEDERRRLKRMLVDLRPPEDCGFIIRTEAVDKDIDDLDRDLAYLSGLWDQIKERRDAGPGPAELYTEGDLVTRTVRDVFSSDVERVVVDNPDVARRVRDVIRISSPDDKDRVEVYDDVVPLFSRYGIEAEIEQMYSRHVPLPSGGSLVIDSTEAVVTIDVNSGKMREHNDAEMTAFKTDMEAAIEIPRQLKLRDLGGVVICDFIDLRYERHRRELEETLFENFKSDRAKTKVLRMSEFGIIEITRQRMRPSLKRSIYFDCPHCKGAGLVKTPESMSLDLMRRMAIAANDMKVARVELSVCADVAFHMLNKKRAAIADLEDRTQKLVVIKIDATLGLDESRFELFDGRDGTVVLEEIGMTAGGDRPHTTQLGVRPPGHTSQARGGRGGRGGDNGRRPDRPRLEPARALEVGDEPEEMDEESQQAIARGEADVDDRERTQGRADQGRRPPMRGREADRANLPPILETEARDEAADDDFADEDVAPADGLNDSPENDQGPRAEGDQQGGDGTGRRRRRRRRRRGRGGDAGPQQGVNPNDPRGTSHAFQGSPGRPADGGTGRDNRAQFAGDLADRVANEFDDADEPNGNVREDTDDGYDDDAVDDGADGAVGTSNDVEPADAIGPAVEGGDSVAEDDLNTAYADGPATAGDAAEGGGRRRRRRGGRRHRRGGEPAGGSAAVLDAMPDDEWFAPGGPADAEPVVATRPEQVAEPVLADDADAGGVVVLTDADALPVGTSPAQAEVAEAVVDQAVAEIATEPDPVDDADEPEVPAPAPKAKRKVAAKKAAPAAKATKSAKVAKKAPAKPPAKAAAKKAPTRKRPAPVADAAGVVPTGTADTHVAAADAADDLVEPVDPKPPGRPKSFNDLDAIPDDFD